MKFYQIIFFVSLILYIYSEGTETGTETEEKCQISVTANSIKDCKDLKTSKPHCCYVKGTQNGSKVNGCLALSKDNYDNIKDYIKKIEKENNADIDKLDCKSIYLELSLLSFVLLFL